jgi:V8-like Glu-specific endopeptidase
MSIDSVPQGSGARPLLGDEIARLPDRPATEEVPDDVAALLAERRLHVAVPEGAADVGQLLREAEQGDEGWHVRLPPGAFLGRPGRTAERLERDEQDLPDQSQTEPHRPPWMPMSYQPRSVGQFAARPPLRSISGRTVQPYYGVFGPDDRQVYYPSAYPWGCIGRVFTWSNSPGTGGWSWSGSGVLVGSRTVLTAGHVCPWGSTNWAMLFEAGYWDGAPQSGPGGQSWVSDYRGWNTNDTVAAHDTAVLRLYDPIGPALGWLGTKVYDSSWDGGPYWTLAGYPGAIAGAERPSYQPLIPVNRDDDDGDAKEIKHQGDATAGDSGGPFFGYWDSAPYSVGVTSGGESVTSDGTVIEDFNVEAGGRYLVDLVTWAQANWT